MIDHRDPLNRINVFPAPDGDTGTNLAATRSHTMGSTRVTYSVGDTIGLMSDAATIGSMSDAAIIGARGNSGAIFAQFLADSARPRPNRPASRWSCSRTR